MCKRAGEAGTISLYCSREDCMGQDGDRMGTQQYALMGYDEEAGGARQMTALAGPNGSKVERRGCKGYK